MSFHHPVFRSVSLVGENRSLPVLIYALVDPRTSEVHYVGQTHNPVERLRAHCIAASACNYRIKQWVNELHDARLQPKMRGIVRCSDHDASEEERYWIRFYRRLGAIYNVLDGGKGGEGDCRRCGAKLTCERCKEASRASARDQERREAVEARRAARLDGKLVWSAADVLGKLSREIPRDD